MPKFVVVEPNGQYAGGLCDTFEEARELAIQKPGRVVGEVYALPGVNPHYHCPVNGWDCPYYKQGICTIGNPIEECEDFASVWGEDEDYTCEGGIHCDSWSSGG